MELFPAVASWLAYNTAFVVVVALYSLGRDLRVIANDPLAHELGMLREIQDRLDAGPSPEPEPWKRWRDSVQELRVMAENVLSKQNEGSSQTGKYKLLKKATDLATEGGRLVSEVASPRMQKYEMLRHLLICRPRHLVMDALVASQRNSMALAEAAPLQYCSGTGLQRLQSRCITAAEAHPALASRDANASKPADESAANKPLSFYQEQALDFVERGTGSSPSWLLGIWGIRGVGKTTLLRFVRDSYGHDSSFSHVFFVGAGTGCTVGRLQHFLSINIGLPPPQISHVSMTQVSSYVKRKTLLLLDDVRERLHHLAAFGLPITLGRVQAKVISSYLKQKTFLLLLDDVWGRLDLAEAGLPMPLGHKQKVIFTTRDQATCAEMGGTTSNAIQMKCLGEDDAWDLFRDKAGDEIINSHPHIKRLAKKMVAECHGLPSALCALGRAMSTKRDVKEWRYAYDVLKSMRQPAYEIQEIDDQDYYSHLHNLEEALKESFF